MNCSLFEKFEGPLSKKQPELLIVLKEPHGDEWNSFWMRDEVMQTRTGVYFHKLGAYARKILSTETKIDALERSAFINLYPYNGKSRTDGGGYEKLINHWYDHTFEPDMHAILKNRLSIIRNALDSGIPIMTVGTTIDILVKEFDLIQGADYGENLECYKYKNDTKVYKIYHPAYSTFGYEKMGNALNFNKRIDEID